MSATNQLLTPAEVADGVVAELISPGLLAPTNPALGSVVWSQTVDSANCRRSRLPLYTDAEIQSLRIDVIPELRGRGLHRADSRTPARGRTTRQQIDSSIWLRIMMQQLVAPDATGVYSSIDALEAFLCQVDDHWHASGRQITTLASRTGIVNLVPFHSEVTTLSSPKDLDSKGLWVGEIKLNIVSLAEQW